MLRQHSSNVARTPTERALLVSFPTRVNRRRPHPRRAVELYERHRDTLAVFAFSTLFHTVLLMLLAMIVFHLDRGEPEFGPLSTRMGESTEAPDSVNFVAPQSDAGHQPGEVAAQNARTTLQRILNHLASAEPVVPMPDARVFLAPAAADAGHQRLQSQFAGRASAAKAALLEAYGGNADSESAVAAGLKWLAAHQHEDGGWSFDHTTGECDATCSGPGSLDNCRIGATAMALLSFLGAGYTHRDGSYREVVEAGLDFILNNSRAGDDGVDLRDDPAQNAAMYVQGMATMVLCEAYAMTADRRLRDPAQHAVDFIVRAQDPGGGGWRYQPRAAGDTSVVGWQAMALTSARVAGLDVPPDTIDKAVRFLKSVESVRSSVGFGYTNRQPHASTTAIGLLCRMYLEPSRTQTSFRAGAQYLGRIGPSSGDMYYNYYATQFMHHFGGPHWDEWNRNMRDWLVAAQERSGHAAGSWPPRDRHANSGGRLYVTCMSIMTLEVYYRHLPLYKHAAQTATD